MIVLDSSAVLALVLEVENDGPFVAEQLALHEIALAPCLLDAEVVSGLRRLVASGAVGETRAIVALAHVSALRILRRPLLPLTPRVWELWHTVSTSDAFFVALAEDAGVPLVTTDRRLARTHGHRAAVLAP